MFIRFLTILAVTGLFGVSINTAHAQSVKQGEYLFQLGGCASCHTREDGPALAGGYAMNTPFGTFYTPNISPDEETGIGGWSDDDFVRAMREGVSPSGQHYYPSFPYTSYAKMSRDELIAIKRYLDSQPPVREANKKHSLAFPYNIRTGLWFWKAMYFKPERYKANSTKTQSWNRGAYLVNGPGHCVECHSPRNGFGAVDISRNLEGNPEGPDDEEVPGLTMDESNRISEWSDDEIIEALQDGAIPDGDYLGGSMGHVIDNTTSKMNDADLQAITEYLQSL